MSATVTNCLDDTSAANHVVPASDTQLAISCDDAGTCVNTVDATLDTPDGVRACIVVSGQGHTIKADSAVAVQTTASTTLTRYCSPFYQGRTFAHNLPLKFTDDAALAAWKGVSGTYSEFSFDTNIGASTAICEGVASSEAGAGVPQFCGGQCDMVFLGRKDVSTSVEKRIYASACRVRSEDYDITRLAFTDFEVRYTAVINGTVWNLWQEQPADMTLSVESLELANPFEGYEMAVQGGDYNTAYASQSAMSVTNCNGYCGFASSQVSDLLLTMYGSCVTPSDGCTSGSSTCTATVQSFDQSRAGEKLPVTVSNATLQYNNTNVIVSVLASAIPLRGRVEFSVPNAERVLPSEAATNVNGITTTLLPQDANHEDVVVVYTDGAVATASRDCAFTLLETRDKNRMYSMRNVRNVTECDLLLSNGTSERSLSVAAQTTKNSGATAVANATALWPAHSPGSESRSSGLSKGAKIGIGVGVPVGVIVIACAILLFVYRCCRKKRAVTPLSSEEAVEPEEESAAKEGNPLSSSVAAVEGGVTAVRPTVAQGNSDPTTREMDAIPVKDVAAKPPHQTRSRQTELPVSATTHAAKTQTRVAAPSKRSTKAGLLQPENAYSDDFNTMLEFLAPGLALSDEPVGHVQNTQNVLSNSKKNAGDGGQWSTVPKPPRATEQSADTQCGVTANCPSSPRPRATAPGASEFAAPGMRQGPDKAKSNAPLQSTSDHTFLPGVDKGSDPVSHTAPAASSRSGDRRTGTAGMLPNTNIDEPDGFGDFDDSLFGDLDEILPPPGLQHAASRGGEGSPVPTQAGVSSQKRATSIPAGGADAPSSEPDGERAEGFMPLAPPAPVRSLHPRLISMPTPKLKPAEPLVAAPKGDPSPKEDARESTQTDEPKGRQNRAPIVYTPDGSAIDIIAPKPSWLKDSTEHDSAEGDPTANEGAEQPTQANGPSGKQTRAPVDSHNEVQPVMVPKPSWVRESVKPACPNPPGPLFPSPKVGADAKDKAKKHTKANEAEIEQTPSRTFLTPTDEEIHVSYVIPPWERTGTRLPQPPPPPRQNPHQVRQDTTTPSAASGDGNDSSSEMTSGNSEISIETALKRIRAKPAPPPYRTESELRLHRGLLTFPNRRK